MSIIRDSQCQNQEPPTFPAAYCWKQLAGKWSRSDESQSRPYLLFDAGGTLVFPDQTFIIQEAGRQGIALTDDQLFNGYYQLIYSLDHHAYHNSGTLPDPWPLGYVYDLFRILKIHGAAANEVAQAFEEQHRCRNMWTFTFKWVEEALWRLAAQGYRMSVISNSDGRTAEVFSDLGLTCYFDEIFDSVELRVEKPDPEIFRKALKHLNVAPTNVLYIGDIYHVDVLGANRAGVAALHLDPSGLCNQWPGVHLRRVSDLLDWLVIHSGDLLTSDLFPFGSPYSRVTACSTGRSVQVERPVVYSFG